MCPKNSSIELLKRIKCSVARIYVENTELISGICYVLIAFTALKRIDSFTSIFISCGLFFLILAIPPLITGTARIVKKPIKLPPRAILFASFIIFIIPLFFAVVSLNAWAVWFGFSSEDSMIIFQILGFLLLIPKITKITTLSIFILLIRKEYYHHSNSLYNLIKEFVMAYAIIIIVMGYAFQTEALQYFLYDNNLI